MLNPFLQCPTQSMTKLLPLVLSHLHLQPLLSLLGTLSLPPPQLPLLTPQFTPQSIPQHSLLSNPATDHSLASLLHTTLLTELHHHYLGTILMPHNMEVVSIPIPQPPPQYHLLISHQPTPLSQVADTPTTQDIHHQLFPRPHFQKEVICLFPSIPTV